ncbi:MAG: transcription termination/antitermination factor NusG [Planctomycetes bacterium]|nr:transcription termination/antitermination factor NusG [Planctomycetota bacterium]
MATWYTLKVQPEREEKIRGLLEQRIISKGLQDQIRTVLIPTEAMAEIRGGKKRIVEHKMYPGYLFAEMDLSEETWYLITETTGVTGFVASNPQAPKPLSEAEISKILKEIDDKKEKPKPKVEFEVEDHVRIKEGPFQNYEGVVEEVFPAKGILRVNVHIFGRSTPVELEYYQVERS